LLAGHKPCNAILKRFDEFALDPEQSARLLALMQVRARKLSLHSITSRIQLQKGSKSKLFGQQVSGMQGLMRYKNSTSPTSSTTTANGSTTSTTPT
jgi:hypothetical protein